MPEKFSSNPEKTDIRHALSNLEVIEEMEEMRKKYAIAPTGLMREFDEKSVKKHSKNETEKTTFILSLYLTIVFAIPLLFVLPYMPFSEWVLSISKMCFFVYVVLAVLFVISSLKKKSINKVLCFFMTLYMLLSTPYTPVLFGYKTTQIGDFYEAKSYTEKYYVIMSREPEHKSNRKAYTLPALIERDLEHATEYDEYHINYLYFPNGGYLTFDTCEPEHNGIYPNEEVSVYDYHGDEYYITLTKQKVK
jgi:hypothetical protein